ncbi:MAG: DUF4010 domain-containing protein [Rhodospirillaceae bacterium]|nr:MAG: DUF4010 domain-containing protein [Rhodospirillaceae bacterium]
MIDSPLHALALTPIELAGRLSLALAMAIFVGLAFEEIYKHEERDVPGGVRTFPMLALGGTMLYLVDPDHALAFVAGLLGLAAWLYAYVRAKSTAAAPVLSLMVPATNMLVYGMGPIAVTQPPWILVAVSVAAVLLLGQREHMHRLVSVIPQDEVLTAGKFLILAGVIFPLVPREPIVAWTPITPYQVWLAVLAISTLSYASYLLQRYLPSRGDTLIPAILGGTYSSTATTVVLAREQRRLASARPEISAGIVAATTVMYLRTTCIILIFDQGLGLTMLPFLGTSFLIGGLVVAREWSRVDQGQLMKSSLRPASNPLALGSAAVFASLFVVVSILAAWVSGHLGERGIMGLAAISGVTDIDPFVLNLVQGGAPTISKSVLGAGILIAIASNNILKAAYAVGFGTARYCRRPALGLLILATTSLVGTAILLGIV